MTSDLDYDDLFHQGVGAGLSALGWLEVVAGRFLRQHERRELAAGWLAGFRELEASRRANAEAADWRKREDAMASELLPVCDGDDEIPW